MKKKWKNLKMPHTYALLMMVIVVAVILTYIIPAGTFERQKIHGQTVVVPDSFQMMTSQPAHFLDIFRAIPEGLISGAEIIFYIFLVGGAFGVIHQTGAFEASIQRLMFQLGRFNMLMIPLTMLIFSILGFSIGLAEETIIFVPIGIIIARTLGYDAMTGAAMVILGSASGFIGGMLNPFTVGVAQTVAELPLFSGWGLRTIIYIFILCAAITVVMIYARRVKQQPERSIVYSLEQEVEKETHMTEQKALTKRQLLSIVIIVGAIALNVYGIFRYDWSFNEMSANFLLAGIVGGIVGGLGFNGTFDALVEGMKNILFGAMIVGFAKGIIVILEQGQIIDTIVYAMTGLLEGLPPVITIIGMFIFQFFLNFFIPSGSGQALTTMPLLVPISDLLEVNRQITVLAFQYGDAISNSLFPTSAVLMGALAVAQISYGQWLKFVWKLILIWVVICMMAMSIAYLVGY
ncbi:YfcC family protein [Staphylococcus intermedius]|uniref:Short-chain fatty acids transporter n=1 Tax=Staphylococcus intermedius NCTC 11048 TaxID=1141106 RepID=A0A380G458_STAIN|nr:AbgT family transporter [Staphylococcus intermedius]PCF63786.1 C4-dicarboxylate ABC transporter permease [Staphylococcus intermedius]PCF78501.1 C4-dicarboxylate ABC transporter permease [Staphylococcus intermedius]PCF79474.1 C4-dicarboxylate ABC transporter permease [Staphylococcus intermedius]PCF86789.1 C4-dicarboxylate ABC transporter permease [Staphylococcus intermedius]PCF89869.1 C4-dicarboxylate ABC transporter permease [Staphylococcus intermedius]